ncbi:MAG: metallophosphoesterase [Bacteroidales bacterium]|nr:metallophosphoesterase [Bacteroidales bacterium]
MFLLIIGIYLGACVYIAVRVAKSLDSKVARVVSSVVVAALTLLFPLQRMIMGVASEGVVRVVYLVGTLWLVVVLYSIVMFLIFGIARFIAKKKNGEVPRANMGTIWRTLLIVFIIIVCGMVNAYTPKVTRYTVHAEKMNEGDTIKIALASDIHAGYAIRKGDVERLVRIVNSEKVDFCILAGDIFDGDIRPVIDNDLCAPLREMKTRRGVIAAMGNHEYMADGERAAEYLRTLNLTLLRDSAMAVSSTSFDMQPYIWFIGRDDMSRNFRMGPMAGLKGTKNIEELDNDTCQVKIVIDHQPGRTDESERIGADLHVSGHTHSGQVWPMKILTGMIYENDYGHTNKGKTDIIVTSGFGTWGPRVRIGNSPEVVVIEITK